MRLIGLTVENFRCYRNAITVRFGDLTALVGRNDIGKSTLMEALAVFFEAASLDKDDACKIGDPLPIKIICEFDQLPIGIVVDAEYETSLADEYLITAEGTLKVQKTYSTNGSTPKLQSVCAIALHPTAGGFSDLLTLKKSDLAKRASELEVDLDGIDRRVNAKVRRAIWDACDDLQLSSVEVPLEAEGTKPVWSVLQQCLPSFALFKSDRASTDQDAEAQDPLKAAIKEALKGVEPQLKQIQEFVEEEVRKIAEATVDKLREMDPEIAETLNPVISAKPWSGLFSTSITGDEGIPLNKRGSGVKRLVLLNFFRARAEKDALEKQSGAVIYAVEEPETSQHPRNQRLLLNSLRDLAGGDGRQVIVTTHTPMLARCLNESDLRFIEKAQDGTRQIHEGGPALSSRIAASLGVLPDHTVKIFVAVEGPHDIAFLQGISRKLVSEGLDLPDLEQLELNGDLIFVPLGGSTLALWASRLAALNRPEFHICDRDNPPPAHPKYNDHILAVNARPGCEAVATSKRELENYLHRDAIIEAYSSQNIAITLPHYGDFDDVPSIVAAAVCAAGGGVWQNLSDEVQRKKESRAKRTLNSLAVGHMNLARLDTIDPQRELIGWLQRIRQLMAN